MNYESTLEEAESHTRNCDTPRVVSVLDKSDKLLSLVSVKAKRSNAPSEMSERRAAWWPHREAHVHMLTHWSLPGAAGTLVV